MKLTPAAAFAAMMGAASAAQDARTFNVLRHTNTGLMQCRFDPIVSPGVVSSHGHNILGSNKFSWNSTGDILNTETTCSTARVVGDNSNYWHPMLYHHNRTTGVYTEVPPLYHNMYYFNEATDDTISPFPLGLSMLSGNPMDRSPPAFGGGSNLDPGAGPIQPIQATCPRDTYTDPYAYPLDSNGTWAGLLDLQNLQAGAGFPQVDCDIPGAPLRMDAHFPSCYDPTKTVSDYKNNMAWPTDAPNSKQNCPPGWIHTPHLFVETYFQTNLFAGTWEDSGIPPWVLSPGDCTGYGWHVDFMSGWDTDVMQYVIDNCNEGDTGMDACPGLPLGVNTDSDCYATCPLDEVYNGTISSLPGASNNPPTGWSCGGVNYSVNGTTNSTTGMSGSSTLVPSASSLVPSAASSLAGSATISTNWAQMATGVSSAGSVSTKTGGMWSNSTVPAMGNGNAASSTPAMGNGNPAASSPAMGNGNAASSSALGNGHGASNHPQQSAPATGAASNPASPSGANSMGSNPSAPASLPTGSAGSECAAQATTIYKTVTVTAGVPAASGSAPAGTGSGNSTSSSTVAGFQSAGCYQDSVSRALNGVSMVTNLGPLTNDLCINYCNTNGFTLAGTEYGNQCFCGNELDGSSKLADSACNMACEGDSTETCGGSWALSVYSQNGQVSLKSAKVRRAPGHVHHRR